MTALTVAPGVGYDVDSKFHIANFVLNEDGSYTGNAIADDVTAEHLLIIAADKAKRAIAALESNSKSSEVTKQKVSGVVQHLTGYLGQALQHIDVLKANITPTANEGTLKLVKGGVLAALACIPAVLATAVAKLEDVSFPEPVAEAEESKDA